VELLGILIIFIFGFVVIPCVWIYKRTGSIKKTSYWFLIFLALPIIGIAVFLLFGRPDNHYKTDKN